MDDNDCCNLKFKICILQLDLLQQRDESFATEHCKVVNSFTNNAQRVLHHGVVQP